ncbi:hypothetical protein ORJ04_03195 [Rheinheimera baltica]|uniref:Lipoprotein n=1 Tax=Rheinheimera baltica TaxID=67576 RepID=A0ABT9HV15_9GAMM|nr:DVU3141 family protein [Rheinheimera baltica]MDP5134951.1 hypothetical protein [Rheinheimera baltica]MDP5149798.1 hypothetical protein [Rheinheimera baltica]
MSIKTVVKTAFLLTVMCLISCSTVEYVEKPNVTIQYLSPLLVASLQESHTGVAITLADPPWIGQYATKTDSYFSASGKNCIKFNLESSAGVEVKLICEHVDGLWAQATHF